MRTPEEQAAHIAELLQLPAPPHLLKPGKHGALAYLKKAEISLEDAIILRMAISLASGKKFDYQTFENLVSRVWGKTYVTQRKKDDQGRDIEEASVEELMGDKS